MDHIITLYPPIEKTKDTPMVIKVLKSRNNKDIQGKEYTLNLKEGGLSYEEVSK